MNSDEISLHLAELYSYARPRMMTDPELDEVLTNTFSEALRNGPRQEELDQLDSTWLVGILRNQIRLYYRNKYKSEKSIANVRESVRTILDSDFDASMAIMGFDQNLLKQSDNQAFWSAVDECLKLLNPVHAEIFILRDLEDVSVKEVCHIFSLSQADVLELNYRARMTVVACLVKQLKP